jgi:hypothetical protein
LAKLDRSLMDCVENERLYCAGDYHAQAGFNEIPSNRRSRFVRTGPSQVISLHVLPLQVLSLQVIPLKLSADNSRMIYAHVGWKLYGSFSTRVLNREYFQRLDVAAHHKSIRDALQATPLWDFVRDRMTSWSGASKPSDLTLQLRLEIELRETCAAWRFTQLTLTSAVPAKGVGQEVQKLLNHQNMLMSRTTP